MTSLKTPLTIITPNNEEKNNNQVNTNDKEKNSKTERRYTYKDGCSVIIFLVLIMLSILLVAFCVSKYYTQGRRIKNLKMLNCCKRRMLINAIIANLTEEMANDMRIMFEIKEAEMHTVHLPEIRNHNNSNNNNNIIESEVIKLPLYSDGFRPFNFTFKIFEDFDKAVNSIFHIRGDLPNITGNVMP